MKVYEAIGPKISSEYVALFSFYLLSIVCHATATLRFSGFADAFIINVNAMRGIHVVTNVQILKKLNGEVC